MFIKRVKIKNYRNLENISVQLGKTTALIGKNNSGKSNFLEAITLPLAVDEIATKSKNLKWDDINNNSKETYYNFIIKNLEKFKENKIIKDDFSKIIPQINVTLEFEYKPDEMFLVKDFFSDIEEKSVEIQYVFSCNNIEDLINEIRETSINIPEDTSDDEILKKYKMNLLPIELFDYKIIVPNRNARIPHEKLKNFSYNFISENRDTFSSYDNKLGSRHLTNLLQSKLTTQNKMDIEKEYTEFFDKIKKMTDMDSVFNWQEYTIDVDNATEFFQKINILPNMPPMNSLLNRITLGYEDISISNHGLGYRNLIFLLVMINSLQINNNSIYSLLSVEEPEAHLSYDNQQLLKSFISSINSKENNLQIVYSTHETNFINKIDISNIIFLSEGKAFSFSEEYSDEELNYLTKNPNLDIFKIFFAQKCILVEGVTEELFIRTYLTMFNNQLHNIEVLSFHKGYTKIIKIWKKINRGSNNALGIVRDSDYEIGPQIKHEALRDENVFVETTSEYSFEEEMVYTSNNFEILKQFFIDNYDFDKSGDEAELINFWKKGKSRYILDVCNGLLDGSIIGLSLPKHIEDILKDMQISIGNNHEY